MSKKVSLLAAIVLAFAALDLQAAQISCSWVGCDDGLWGDPTNWSCAMVPDNNEVKTFAVTIDGGTGRVEVGLEQDRTIDQLDCYGAVELECWNAYYLRLSLEDANGLTNHGDLKIEDHMEIDGDLFNLPDCKIKIHGKSVDVSNLDNAGSIMVTPNTGLWAYHTLHNSKEIKVYGGQCGAGEIFDNNSTSVISGFGFLHAQDLLRNKGAIYAYDGPLLIIIESPWLNSGVIGNSAVSSLHVMPFGLPVDVNNNGTIEVNAGGGVAFDCNLVNKPNGVIKLLGGTLAATTITQSADANFAGFGGITGDVIIDANGIIQLTGPTNIIGDVEINPNATLEISDGLTLVTGHTTCNGTIHLKGGYFIPQGGLSGDCNIIWEPGTYTNVADFNLDGQVSFKDFAYFANTWLWQTSWN